MAMVSGVYGKYITSVMTNALAWNLGTDTFKLQLVTDTHTPDFNLDSIETDIDNEVTGTGWTTGGETLANPAFTNAAGIAKFDVDDLVTTGTTLSSIEGAIVLDSTLTNSPLLSATDFGTTYNTSSSTLTLTVDANGVFYYDHTP